MNKPIAPLRFSKLKVFLACSFIFVFVRATSAQDYSDAIIGKWMSDNQKCKVEIYKSNNAYYGKIIWLNEPNDPATGKPKTDTNNSDPSQQNIPLIGLVVLRSFEFTDGFWQNGEVYDSQNGKKYDCEMWLDDQNHLKIKGSWSFIYRVDTWTRCS